MSWLSAPVPGWVVWAILIALAFVALAAVCTDKTPHDDESMF